MEFERAQAYARLAGEEKGRKEKAVEAAIVLIKDFNISPEIAAEKMGADYNDVLIALQK